MSARIEDARVKCTLLEAIEKEGGDVRMTERDVVWQQAWYTRVDSGRNSLQDAIFS